VETKTTIINEPAKIQTIETVEKTSITQNIEVKKNERPSKLRDLFESTPITKGSFIGSKNVPRKASTSGFRNVNTGVVVSNKPKVNDVQKSLDEKRRLLQ
jgi:hypothetical protein